MFKVFLVIVSLAIFIDSANSDLINTQVDRVVDLTSHLVHITDIITVENTGKSAIKTYNYLVSSSSAGRVSYVGAELTDKSIDEKKRTLKSKLSTKDAAKGNTYQIDFQKDLAPSGKLSFKVETVLFDSLRPYPDEITQAEKQYALFTGNHYLYSSYTTKTQTTKVKLASDKVESYSQLKPTSKSGSEITYGPYNDVKPLEESEMSIHFETNVPFLKVSNVDRLIEVSHWGNIAVEETVDMYHSGAKLKGPFSRFDYMRKQGGASSVKSFKTLLPPSAKDVYYRDEIGNISTSNMRLPSRSKSLVKPIELELKPRFPLFGGWKTHYTIGYNVPIYQFLFNKGSDFTLKMKLIDHIYDDQFVEQAKIRVILPEHSTNIELITAFPVERGANKLHYTYLDTVGRPVVVISLKNIAENHIQDFQIKYNYQQVMLLQKPLLLVGVFFFLYTVMIILARLNFSISSSTTTTTEHAKKE